MSLTRHARPGRSSWLPALLLCVLGFAPYLGSVGNGFVNFDDDHYIYENPQVLRGLTGEGVLWALTSTEHANWYPLRRLSHLVDASLFGMWAGGHHLVSAAWHAGAAALLFLALRQMTGALGRSFAVAGLFAVHPLQAESVAWAAERSNVQAGFFFALTLLLWARYVRRPGGGRYAAALAACALGLAAKPTLVPLPLMLLLLDFWPLGRAGSPGAPPWKPSRPTLWRLLTEKAPLLLFAAGSTVIATVAHRQADAMQLLDALPLATRFENAALSCLAYLGKLFWPRGLAVYYPHPGRNLVVAAAVMAGVLLVALTGLVVWQGRRRPWVAVGWLWYLVLLAPVSGVVQFGRHAMADRFVYLPCIGLFAALAWLAREALPGRVRRGAAPVVLVGGALAAFAAATAAQTGKWRDSVTLYTHSLAHTSGNWLLELNLGNALLELGRTPEAEERYRTALRLKPDFLEARLNLGNALVQLGRVEEGVAQYREVVRLRPGDAKAHNNLGVALYERGEFAAAAASFREVLRLRPGDAKTHENLAIVLSRLGRPGEAAAHRREAERLRGAQGLKGQEAAPPR